MNSFLTTAMPLTRSAVEALALLASDDDIDENHVSEDISQNSRANDRSLHRQKANMTLSSLLSQHSEDSLPSLSEAPGFISPNLSHQSLSDGYDRPFLAQITSPGASAIPYRPSQSSNETCDPAILPFSPIRPSRQSRSRDEAIQEIISSKNRAPCIQNAHSIPEEARISYRSGNQSTSPSPIKTLDAVRLEGTAWSRTLSPPRPPGLICPDFPQEDLPSFDLEEDLHLLDPEEELPLSDLDRSPSFESESSISIEYVREEDFSQLPLAHAVDIAAERYDRTCKFCLYME